MVRLGAIHFGVMSGHLVFKRRLVNPAWGSRGLSKDSHSWLINLPNVRTCYAIDVS